MTEYHKVGDETIILDSKTPSDGHESRTLLTSAVTVRDVLTSGFSIVQIVITFIVTFLLNFLIVYYGEGGQRLVMVGIASPSGGILTSSALSPIFQTLLQTAGLQAWLDKERQENNLSILDIEMQANAWWARLMPGIRSPRLISRCLWFSIQFLGMIAIPVWVILWFSCSWYPDCSMKQTEHALLMGFVIGAQSIINFPLIFMAAMYDTFVTRRGQTPSNTV